MTGDERGSAVLVSTYNSAGLFNPLLRIVGELKARGVRNVWFASTEDRRADVEGLPGPGEVSFVSLGPALPQSSPDTWDDATYRALTNGDRADRFARYLDVCTDFDYIQQLYRRCLEVIDDVQPAVAVVDSQASWAMDAAQTRQVPFLVSISTPPSNFLQELLPPRYPAPFSGLPARMTPRQQAANAGFRSRLVRALMEPDRLRRNLVAIARRKAAGLRNPEMRPALYAEDAAALMSYTVFGFEYPFPTAPAKLRMLGPVVPRQLPPADRDDELDRWLDDHPSVVYVGFGTIMRPSEGQMRTIVEVADRLGPEHAVLWKLPAAQQRLLPSAARLPGNLRVEEWLPCQLRVLAHPHVRVFFNHGAANAIHEAVHFATPQLVMPFWLDCPDGVVRAVDSGVALAVEHTDPLDVEDILAKIGRLLDEDSFRERAELCSQRMRQAGGLTVAADLVLRHRDEAAAHRTVGAAVG
ncbi:UDP-glucoronosyl and UDP-glucosyl transferase [Micromonospora sp. MW-13]|uniref:glycosyltransferase n=1 Tax=Micromonospora sp. MW-13 TaxID=2094022 RepID=UPI000EC77E14|nr:glycosyltransferase [Micromonospora sp. MW-13]RGC66906.1 UDP-glucoronosyl and UDP-glucosyl transferase [Micromonospora sp. MW-13]